MATHRMTLCTSLHRGTEYAVYTVLTVEPDGTATGLRIVSHLCDDCLRAVQQRDADPDDGLTVASVKGGRAA